MRLILSIVFSLITPFDPKWTFSRFATENKKETTTVISFVFGILTISTVYFLTQNGAGRDTISQLVHVLVFAIGLSIRSLFISYLLLRFINRLELAKLNWADAFAIVSFALVPLSTGYIWALIDIETAYIGKFIGWIWNAILLIAGLKIFKKVTFWKGALLVFGILTTLKIAESLFFGTVISY